MVPRGNLVPLGHKASLAFLDPQVPQGPQDPQL